MILIPVSIDFFSFHPDSQCKRRSANRLDVLKSRAENYRSNGFGVQHVFKCCC